MQALRQSSRVISANSFQAPHALKPDFVRFATNEKAVKLRMKSVGSIRKITKAMKMVAASKLRAEQRRLDNGRPFVQAGTSLFTNIKPDQVPAGVGAVTTPEKPKSAILVPITSDRGLCGGVNSSIAKLAKLKTVEMEKEGAKVEIMTVGDKGKAALQRQYGDRFSRNIWENWKNGSNFGIASAIADRIINSNADAAFLMFNRFQSVIAFNSLCVPLLSKKQFDSYEVKMQLVDYEFEGDEEELSGDLYEFYVASSVYQAMLENATSEQSARMTAMDNASKNAGEMLEKLSLQYNKARQARITTELIEIISGAVAV